MLEAIKKSILGAVTYMIVCGLIFLMSFSIYTKKFPPDLKQLKTGFESISKLSDSLNTIQKQQAELLKIDSERIPLQINSTNEYGGPLNQKVSEFENQNNYLIQKMTSLEQNHIKLLQRIENLERIKHSH